MSKAMQGKVTMARRCAAALTAWALLFSLPAHAQFSDGYKFLEAVRKKEGQKVEDALAEPGSYAINSRDVVSGETALPFFTAAGNQRTRLSASTRASSRPLCAG